MKTLAEQLMRDLEDQIERGKARLDLKRLKVDPSPVPGSEIAIQWPNIERNADQGVITAIERRGVPLVILPITTLIGIVAMARGGRTVGEIMDGYSGVDLPRGLTAHAPGGPVQSLKMPKGEPDIP